MEWSKAEETAKDGVRREPFCPKQAPKGLRFNSARKNRGQKWDAGAETK